MGFESAAPRDNAIGGTDAAGSARASNPSHPLELASFGRPVNPAAVSPGQEEHDTTPPQSPKVHKPELKDIQADLDGVVKDKQALEAQLATAQKLLNDKGLAAAIPAYDAAIKAANQEQPKVLQEIKQVSNALRTGTDPNEQKLLTAELEELNKLKRAPSWTQANKGLAERNEGLLQKQPGHVAQGEADLRLAAALDPKMCDDSNFQTALNDKAVCAALKKVEPRADVQLVAATTDDTTPPPPRDVPSDWQTLSPVQQADWLLTHPAGPQLSQAERDLFQAAIKHADNSKDPTPKDPSPRLTALLHDKTRLTEALKNFGVDTNALNGIRPNTLDETDARAADLIDDEKKVPRDQRELARGLYIKYRTATGFSELADVRRSLTGINQEFGPILDEIDAEFQWNLNGPRSAPIEAFKLNKVNREIDEEEYPKIFTRHSFASALRNQKTVGDTDKALADEVDTAAQDLITGADRSTGPATATKTIAPVPQFDARPLDQAERQSFEALKTYEQSETKNLDLPVGKDDPTVEQLFSEATKQADQAFKTDIQALAAQLADLQEQIEKSTSNLSPENQTTLEQSTTKLNVALRGSSEANQALYIEFLNPSTKEARRQEIQHQLSARNPDLEQILLQDQKIGQISPEIHDAFSQEATVIGLAREVTARHFLAHARYAQVLAQDWARIKREIAANVNQRANTTQSTDTTQTAAAIKSKAINELTEAFSGLPSSWVAAYASNNNTRNLMETLRFSPVAAKPEEVLPKLLGPPDATYVPEMGRERPHLNTDANNGGAKDAAASPTAAAARPASAPPPPTDAAHPTDTAPPPPAQANAAPTAWEKLEADQNSRASALNDAEKLWDAATAASKDKNSDIKDLKHKYDAALAAEEKALGDPTERIKEMHAVLDEIEAGTVTAPDGTKQKMSPAELINRHTAIVNTLGEMETLVIHRENYADLLGQKNLWADAQNQLEAAGKDSDRIPMDSMMREMKLLRVAQGNKDLDIPITLPGGSKMDGNRYFREIAEHCEWALKNQVLLAMSTTDFCLGSASPILTTEFNEFPGFGTTPVSKPDLAYQYLEKARVLKEQVGDIVPGDGFHAVYQGRQHQIIEIAPEALRHQIQLTRDSYDRPFASYIASSVGMAVTLGLNAWGKPQLAAALDDTAATAAASTRAAGLLATAASVSKPVIASIKPAITYGVDSVPLIGSVPVAPLAVGAASSVVLDFGIRSLRTEKNPDQLRDSAIESLGSYGALAFAARFYPSWRATEPPVGLFPPWKAFRGVDALTGLKRMNDWGSFAVVGGMDTINTSANALVNALHGENVYRQFIPESTNIINSNALLPRLFTLDLASSRLLEPKSPPAKPGWLGWRSGLYRLNPDQPMSEMSLGQKITRLSTWNFLGSQMEVPLASSVISNGGIPLVAPGIFDGFIPATEEQIRRTEQPTVNGVSPKPN